MIIATFVLKIFAATMLLLFAVLLLGTATLMAITAAPIPAGTWYHQLAMLTLALAYFGLGWTRTGQTLGMKTWRIRVSIWRMTWLLMPRKTSTSSAPRCVTG